MRIDRTPFTQAPSTSPSHEGLATEQLSARSTTSRIARVPKAFLVALLIAPLLGSPCATPFATMFALDLFGIFGILASFFDLDTASDGVKSAGSTTAWETNGPYGGPVRYGLSIDPNNSNVIYAASSGGVFKTTDGGANWTLLPTTNMKELFEIRAVAVDPTNPAIVYAGNSDSIYAMFKSTDGGATWTSISKGLNAGTVTAIAINPASPLTVLAGSPGGLWRSTDGGANWTRIVSGISSPNITALVHDPAVPTTVYAMNVDSGIYKSTNGGLDWTGINSGFVITGTRIITNGNGFAVDPSTPQRLYAGRYRSINGGATWTAMTGVGVNMTSFAVVQGSNIVYAGDDSGVYKSTDAGTSWTRVNTGLSNLSVWSLAVDPRTAGTVYATTDHGVFKSTNAGASWTAVNKGLANTNVEAVVVDPFMPSTVFAGTYSNGIFRSSDAGGSWVNVQAGTGATTQILGLALDPKTPGTIYAAAGIGAVLKSTNRGATWTSAAVAGRPISIAVDPVTTTTIYVGTEAHGVLKSSNGGATWAAVNAGLPGRVDNASTLGAVRGISVSPQDQSVWAWVQTGDVNVAALISRDGGATWSTSYPGWNPSVQLSGPSLLNFLTNTVALHSISANFVSPQYGWLDTCMPISQVVADPLDSTRGYAAGGCGVGRARFANAQLTAEKLPANTPPYVYANALAITPTGTDLYAGMQWGGVYKFTLDTAPRVVEYYLAERDQYFMTAETVEQAAVDSGAAGPFLRTGSVFKAGGPTPVCRFFGNSNINPATGAFYGPNSHFYTADANECAGLKAQFVANAKSWKFESNDFLTTPAVGGTCPANTTPVYRAYNDGFARGIDSNHRMTPDLAAYQAQVAKGWIGEGIVMCAPK